MAKEFDLNTLDDNQQLLYNSLVTDYPDLASSLSGGQLFDVVNLIWSQREKILGAAELIWDNRDDIVDAVEYVMSYRNQIVDLLEKTPQFLAQTGDFIDAAGGSAIRASALLTGEGDDDGGSVRDMTELAAKAFGIVRVKRLVQLPLPLEGIGGEIDGITIPSIEPEYSEIMGFSVITGMEFGESNLVDSAADRLKRGAKRLEDIGEDFTTVAEQLRKMGGLLNKTGGDLNLVGSQLQQSGITLNSFASATLASEEKSRQQPAKSLKRPSSIAHSTPKPQKNRSQSPKKAGSKLFQVEVHAQETH